MNPYLNALLLKFEGDSEGKDAPTKAQVAVVWAGVATLISLAIR